jgi:hypothetical protein
MKHATLLYASLKAIARNFLQDPIVIIAIIALQANIASAQQLVLPDDQAPAPHANTQNSQPAPTTPAQSPQSVSAQASAKLTIPAEPSCLWGW